MLPTDFCDDIQDPPERPSLVGGLGLLQIREFKSGW
jgi:hypothetical protein